MKVRIINILIRRQKGLLITGILLLACIIGFTKIPSIDGELTGFNMKESEYYQNGLDIANQFGSTTFIQVNIEPSIEDASTVIKSLQKLNEDIHKAFPTSRVESIHKAKRLLKIGDSSNLNIYKVLKRSAELPVVKDVISKDRKSFLMIVFFDSSKNSGIKIDKFDQILEKKYKGLRLKNVMSPYHVENGIAESIVRDMKVVPLLIISLFIALIFIAYRSASALVFTMLIIGVSVLPVFYFLHALEIPLNVITILAIPVLLVLSLADSIHLLTGYRRCKEIMSHDDKLRKVLNRYFVPSIITSLTTASAFLSFLFNDSENIRNFGFITGITVLLAFCMTFSFAPFLLRYVKPKNIDSHYFDRYFKHLTSKRLAYSILLVALFVTSLAFLPSLKFNTNLDSFIPRNTKLRTDHQELIHQYYSQLRIDIMIERQPDQSILEVQTKLIELHKNIESLNDVGRVSSLKDQIEFKSQYGSLSGFIKFPSENNPFVSNDKRFFRIDIRLKDAKNLIDVEKKVRKLAHNKGLKCITYSNGLLINETNSNTADSLFRSLLVSFIFIFGLILTMTRSLLFTSAAILANLIPLSSLVLIFCLFELDLNLLTSVTSIVCLGLIVDDTIHVLYRKVILGAQLEEVSFGIITTSLILFFGFLALTMSSFVPSRVFGATSALVYIVTVITDLTLLPYLLDNIQRIKERTSN